MENYKKEIIIVVSILAIILLVFLVKTLTKTNINYGIVKARNGKDNGLISSYDEFQELVSSSGMEKKGEINLKNTDIENYYNKEFFEKNKLVYISVQEDDSKEYIYSIDDCKYSNGKKDAEVTYTYKTGAYLGPIGKTWYDYMLLEVDKNVENVSYVKNSESK